MMNREQLMRRVEDANEPIRRSFELLLAEDKELQSALEAALDRAFETLTKWEIVHHEYDRCEYDIDWDILYDGLTIKNTFKRPGAKVLTRPSILL